MRPWASRFIADLLYGVTPHDPMVFGTIATIVPVVATFASLLPEWRAIRTQPAESLRGRRIDQRIHCLNFLE